MESSTQMEITFGQTVTILMRMLGYQDSDVGAVWPQGYLNAAANIGLTDGVTMNANAKSEPRPSGAAVL